MRRITLLTVSDCHLCEQAEAVVDRVGADLALEVEILPLDSKQGRRLGEGAGILFPPGVLIDGEPFSYGRLSERRLRRALGA